ncbi:molybdopterin-dependent oxidoreductase [Sciscionella marina]|uniref:molybdopterin-dependent oxidoreductase n=1 Tax=Sciscionella marina TaxID=508770 RepID=UPI0006853070|nr:molybdopterin-dependent oxidoreductase [Sciscionella marina]
MRRRLAYAARGVTAAVFGIGIAEFLGAFLGASSSPIGAVGRFAIDSAPASVKEAAIRWFGTGDKLVLICGVTLVLLALLVTAGLLCLRSRTAGTVLIAVLGIAGALAAAFGTGAGPVDALPSLLAAALGAGSLRVLTRTTGPQAAVESSGVQRRVALGAFTIGAAGLVGGRFLGDPGERAATALPRAADPAPPLPPGHRFALPGLSPFRTANADFYRVDTDLALPAIDPADWTLRIHGAVGKPVALSYRDLLDRPLVERDMTLCCVSNEVGGPYVSTTRWLGVPLATLLRETGIRAGADQLLSTATDGMTIGTPTGLVLDGREAMLVVGMNGEPLPRKHGYPVRMIIPGLYGYASATKWLTELKLTSFAADRAYWVRRGYVEQGTAKTASRIDVPRPFAQLRPVPVTVAGVAWALHRGIEAVQCRVDGGPWMRAELTTDAGPDLWRQWRWTWRAAPGSHRIEVRAVDGTGHMQTGGRAEVFPSGSTGWHSVLVTVSE